MMNPTYSVSIGTLIGKEKVNKKINKNKPAGLFFFVQNYYLTNP